MYKSGLVSISIFSVFLSLFALYLVSLSPSLHKFFNSSKFSLTHILIFYIFIIFKRIFPFMSLCFRQRRKAKLEFISLVRQILKNFLKLLINIEIVFWASKFVNFHPSLIFVIKAGALPQKSTLWDSSLRDVGSWPCPEILD